MIKKIEMKLINMKIHHNQPFQYYNYLIFIATLLFATLLCWGVSGNQPHVHDILLIWVIINFLWLKPIIFKLLSPLFLVWILFFPIGLQYGYPTSAMIFSALETNRNEVTEFFDPLTLWIYLGIIILTLIILFLTKKIRATHKQRQFFYWFSIILILVFIGSIIPIKHSYFKWHFSKILNIIPYTTTSYHFYKNYQNNLQELSKKPIDWQISTYAPKYKNHVFVLGESMSKYYMSSYGYPVKTTPFLDDVNGVKYNQFISPAGHTTTSVPRLLTIPNPQKVEFQNSIFSLANQAGIETYWISNQEHVGVFDNEVSYIASQANHVYFYGDHNPTKTHRLDHEMLAEIEKAINSPSDKPKFIAIHLMGSHPRFVKRLDNKRPRFYFDNDDLADYLSTIYQTDMFLKEIYQLLHTANKNNNQPFSMVYTSDHGLHQTKLKHDDTQFTLRTPLFKLSSDDSERMENNTPQAGHGFVWFLADWLGIKTHNQTRNTFLSRTEQENPDDIPIFFEHTQAYGNLTPFDGQLLMPKADEIQAPPK